LPTWTADDERAFFERLKRSRSVGNKAQYLVIRADTLRPTGGEKHLEVAIRLAASATDEFVAPVFLGERSLHPGAMLQRAVSCRTGVQAYRDALQARRKLPNVINSA
jgi:hypothetical protein